MYTYGLGNYAIAGGSDAGVWTIIAFVLAIIGAVLAYFLFVKPEKKYPQKFVNWLRNFLNFNEMLIEPILKVTYIFLAIFVTLTSFNYISYSFLTFLLTLTLGNLAIRVAYEFFMVTIGIWKNTKEINKKMK